MFGRHDCRCRVGFPAAIVGRLELPYVMDALESALLHCVQVMNICILTGNSPEDSGRRL